VISEEPLAATVDPSSQATLDYHYDSPGSFHRRATQINPNTLMERGRDPQSIIYTGRLYVDPDTSGRAHASFYLSGGNARLQRELGEFLTADPRRDHQRWRQQWRGLYSKFLFGRMAHLGQRQVVAFWGSGSGEGFRDIKGPEHLVRPYLLTLRRGDYISDDTVVVLTDGSVGRAGDFLTGRGPAHRPSPEEAHKLELARRLHLATGSEKRHLMRLLGVGGGGKRSPWDQALRGRGLAPGQSHWNMSSESFRRRLQVVLDSIPG